MNDNHPVTQLLNCYNYSPLFIKKVVYLNNMINLNTVYFRSPRIVARKTGDEYVLVPVSDTIADMRSVYTLNVTAAFIWEKLDGVRTVRDIISEVEGEFDVDGKTALNDVLSFFTEMKQYLIIAE